MNFELVNAVAQIVAASGVIFTLGYLAVEIRQNTRALRRSAYQELLNYVTNANLMLSADRGLCELSIRARSGLDALDEPDQMRVLAWYGTVFRHYQNAFGLYHEGDLLEVLEVFEPTRRERIAACNYIKSIVRNEDLGDCQIGVFADDLRLFGAGAKVERESEETFLVARSG